MPPCLIFEDDHLLVANKPAGLNTHAPGAYAGEGLYDWLRHREARWADLAIIHRLDKETSGVIVFSKTSLGNRSLTEQFTNRSVKKKYILLTDRPVPQLEFIAKSVLVRTGEKYISRPLHAGGEIAETRFRRLESAAVGFRVKPELTCVEAEPLTGRTHQIRVHAADNGFPVLGDALYGGTTAPRLCLHATEISFKHPASGQPVTFGVKPDFNADTALALRAALLDPDQTNAYRLIHGASDGWPGWYVDRLGDYLLSQSGQPLERDQREELQRLMNGFSARGAYHKLLSREPRKKAPAEASPQLVLGHAAPERIVVRENGLQFELGFQEGYSVGLFLDQRGNRRRLLTRHIGPDFPLSTKIENPKLEIGNWKLEILNAFSYTCGFSVCAAKAGAHTTSLDLSKKYLEWGKRNFPLNGLEPAAHDFIYGDVFDWLRRLDKKDRRFDVILLDPPTFSHSKQGGVFRAEKDYARLVKSALPLLKPRGVLFCSTNAADWRPEDFVASIETTLRATQKAILQKHYFPQPPDFPISRVEPAYLKTLWLRIK